MAAKSRLGVGAKVSTPPNGIPGTPNTPNRSFVARERTRLAGRAFTGLAATSHTRLAGRAFTGLAATSRTRLVSRAHAGLADRGQVGHERLLRAVRQR